MVVEVSYLLFREREREIINQDIRTFIKGVTCNCIMEGLVWLFIITASEDLAVVVLRGDGKSEKILKNGDFVSRSFIAICYSYSTGARDLWQ